MIDEAKGHIKLTDLLVLKPNSKFDLIKNQKLGEVQETRDIGNGFKWLDIKNIQIGDKYFIMSLCFKEEELTGLSMVLDDNPFNLNPNWDSWSEKKENEKLKELQNWLSNEFGNKRNFTWGNVWAKYDPKERFSSIGLRYN